MTGDSESALHPKPRQTSVRIADHTDKGRRSDSRSPSRTTTSFIIHYLGWQAGRATPRINTPTTPFPDYKGHLTERNGDFASRRITSVQLKITGQSV
jgi:hypothetical protein